jgi:hypothetical protein
MQRQLQLSAASGRKQKTHPKNGCRFQTEKFPEFEERLNMFKLDFKLNRYKNPSWTCVKLLIVAAFHFRNVVNSIELLK